MHYLGKPGPHHSKEGGWGGGGGWRKSLPADLILLTFSPPPPPLRHPPHPPALPPSSSERWTALYPVSTEPPFPNKRIINGAFLGAGLSCTITPAPAPILPRFFFSFFLQMGTEKRGYELSTQHLATTKQYQVPQCKHHISATWETFKHLFSFLEEP